MDFFDNLIKQLTRIADGVEKRNALLEKVANEKRECATRTADMQLGIDTGTGYSQNIPVYAMPAPQQATIPNVQMPTPQPTNIPVANTTVNSYTQEQIARALGQAVDVGKGALVQNIFKTYGVRTLMEIPQERYGDIAITLRGEGISI